MFHSLAPKHLAFLINYSHKDKVQVFSLVPILKNKIVAISNSNPGDCRNPKVRGICLNKLVLCQ